MKVSFGTILSKALLTAGIFLCTSISSAQNPLTESHNETAMEKNERRSRQKLAGISQDHIFKFWGELDEAAQKHLVGQVEGLDLEAFRAQQAVLRRGTEPIVAGLEPFTDFFESNTVDSEAIGRELISKGKVGCIIVAGGQGTRLRIDGPKGKYPISIIKQKTLFQLFAEKTLAAGRQSGKMLHLAIMTSPQNREETIKFFADNQNFGLSQLQLHFFCQGSLPLLDTEGDLFLEEKHSISIGPDGNGSCLKAFVESGIWEKWKTNGIEYANFVLIDNPLANPFDATLVGFHVSRGDDVSIKCIKRNDPKEKVGLIVKKDGHADVVEYSEISPDEQTARLTDGSLKHGCANISLFCFNMDFIQSAAASASEMDLHPAFKAVKAIDDEGDVRTPTEPNAWKFERFIFDVLPLANQVSALCYPREDCFAPLKNYEGNDSPSTVRDALFQQDRRVLQRLTGSDAPMRHFELSQDFHYPTAAFVQKWKGHTVPDSTNYYDASTVPQ